jgi:hypothetical protein
MKLIDYVLIEKKSSQLTILSSGCPGSGGKTRILQT